MKICATFLLTKFVGCGIMEIPATSIVAGALKKPPKRGLITPLFLPFNPAIISDSNSDEIILFKVCA